MIAHIPLYAIPAFDMYPLSYNQIFAIILGLIHCFSFNRNGFFDNRWFQKLNHYSETQYF